MEQAVIAHYSEIALKGKNRKDFENVLIGNIKASLGQNLVKIVSMEGRLILYCLDLDKAEDSLSCIFGISLFFPAFILEKDLDKVQDLILDHSSYFKDQTVKVFTSRSDKSFGLTSPQICRKIGQALESSGVPVDLESPQRRIYIWILKKIAIVSFEKNKGLSGLPVGSSGSVISLLSGGMDSPVASWLMMRRGITLDFLHVHARADNSDVKESKIPRLVKALKKYHPQKCRLFIAPYHEFYKKTGKMNPRSELVIFRRFIFRLANRIALQYGHLGIVSGDNIGQVASQTLENLFATSGAATIPVYRPLATYEKQEIINLAKQIGTLDISIEDYKDCCSLVAMKHPSTKVKPALVMAIEQEIGIDAIVEKTIGQMEIIEI